MHTNKRRTRSPPKPLGQLYAQGSSPLIVSHTDNASRASERSLPSGLVNREDPDRIKINPGIGGGPRNEKLLLSFQIVQEKAGWQGQILPSYGVQRVLQRMGGQNRGRQASRSGPTRAWPGRRRCCRTSSHSDMTTLVDKLKLPKYGWTSVDSYWCAYYNLGTKCNIGMHATVTPPEDHRDERRAVLDSQAAVLKWTIDIPRDDVHREDTSSSGLEFECQLNTSTLTRLYQLKELGRTNIMALWRTLVDQQDLIRMGADDFVEVCTRLCIQCGRAWSVSQVDPEGWPGCASCKEEKPEDADRDDLATSRHIGVLVRLALPEEYNSIAIGENRTLVACRAQHFRVFCVSFLMFVFSLNQGFWSWQQTISLLELTHK